MISNTQAIIAILIISAISILIMLYTLLIGGDKYIKKKERIPFALIILINIPIIIISALFSLFMDTSHEREINNAYENFIKTLKDK